MEDAIALHTAIEASDGNVSDVLPAFESARRPVVEKLLGAANSSARWYERMADRMHLSPYAFAHDYMTRTGRVSDDRLCKIAPRFMTRYTDHQQADDERTRP